jgi:hypothetical protein
MVIADGPPDEAQEAESDPIDAAAGPATIVAEQDVYDAILEASFPASDPPPGPLTLL